MLEQKWTRTDADGDMHQLRLNQERWEESLGYRWAVVKLRRDPVAERAGAPKIEVLPDAHGDDGGAEKKIVNEMLAELRDGGQADSVAQ